MLREYGKCISEVIVQMNPMDVYPKDGFLSNEEWNANFVQLLRD
jgi:hypothetical protein